jgi:parallel beta-helix repeat protein
VSAATYYVAPTGNDGASCSAAQSRNTPKRTLRGGAACLAAGDTLYLRAGTYAEDELINPVPSGPSDTTHTTIAGDPQDGALAATIRGTGSGCCLFTFVGSGVNRITLDNLRLDGNGVTGVGVRIGCSNCGPPQFEHTDLAHHITLQNLEILNIKNSGILSGSYNTIYRNNHIHQTGSDGFDHGIYLSDNDTLLQGNVIHDTTGYGIHYFSNDVNVSGAPLHHGVVITGNTTYNNTYSGILVNASDDALVSNNISYNNKDKGLYVWGGNNARIYNNTLYQNGGSCLRNEYGGVTMMRNNLCWQNGNDQIDDDTHGATVDRNLSGVNPQFANPTAADFHLGAQSPARGTGMAIAGITGAPPNIGADPDAMAQGPPPRPRPLPAPTHLRVRTVR